jgi:hypothetical protein
LVLLRDHESETLAGMNTKIVLGSIGGAVLIHATVTACSNANAQSAPTPVQVQTVNCDQTVQVQGPALPPPIGDGGPSSTTEYYAVATYPGLSAEQLAGHVTNWTSTAGIPGQPPGFKLRGQDAIYTADGMVGAGCGGPTETTTFIYAP